MRTYKYQIIPRIEQTGADSYREPVYDVRFVAPNGRVLWYNNQGYTSEKDARRFIAMHRRVAVFATVKMEEPMIYNDAATKGPL